MPILDTEKMITTGQRFFVCLHELEFTIPRNVFMTLEIYGEVLSPAQGEADGYGQRTIEQRFDHTLWTEDYISM